MRWVALAFASTLAVGPVRAAPQTPYTVEHMLRSESFGTAYFDRRGRYLIFDRDRPYGESIEFSWSPIGRVFGSRRSEIFVADLRKGEAPRQLFRSRENEGHTLGKPSPDGRRFAYLRTKDDGVLVGVYDIERRRAIEFLATPDAYGVTPMWISPTRLVFSETAANRLPRAYIERMSAAWEAMRAGHTSTASPIGSGRYAVREGDDTARGLVVADAETGSVRRLGTGLFVDAVVSQDGATVAVQRVESRPLDPVAPLPQFGYQRKVPVVFDVSSPSSKARAIETFIGAGPAVLREARGNATALVVSDALGKKREIMRVNEHLNAVAGGRPVRIDYRAPNGIDATAWILLPSDHEPGRKYATVVNVYPGSVPGAGWKPPDLDRVATFNPHLLAARGYAVLFPSLSVDERENPREPLNGLATHVLAAVDAAIAAGYTDADKLGIQGESYGAYGTVAILSATHRFKAAVAAAGNYDLVSAYGAPRIGNRLNAEFEGQNLSQGVGWAESGQGGMSGPPWRDPQRYLRNSPLMRVESIQTPLLLVHGDLDSTLSFGQSEALFTALYRLNKDVVFVRYWGEGHRVAASPANLRDLWTRLFAWYGEHLGLPEHQAIRP